MKRIAAALAAGFFAAVLCGAQNSADLSNFRQEGIASWYGAEFDGRPTASGEIFNASLYTAAHPTLPFGTLLTVTNMNNGRTVNVRVNDRGPFVSSRIIDLSQAAAQMLDMVSSGTAPVTVEIMKTGAASGQGAGGTYQADANTSAVSQGGYTSATSQIVAPYPSYQTPVYQSPPAQSAEPTVIQVQPPQQQITQYFQQPLAQPMQPPVQPMNQPLAQPMRQTPQAAPQAVQQQQPIQQVLPVQQVIQPVQPIVQPIPPQAPSQPAVQSAQPPASPQVQSPAPPVQATQPVQINIPIEVRPIVSSEPIVIPAPKTVPETPAPASPAPVSTSPEPAPSPVAAPIAPVSTSPAAPAPVSTSPAAPAPVLTSPATLAPVLTSPAPVSASPAPVSTAAVKPNMIYRIQVGSYREARNALAAAERLKNSGLNPAYERNGDLFR
ncbi:MAG: septal ring lytic transglycosylase RlpA family protein, partial [Treponema sp.]|nr:septal ring lytic transglycosylase RlpA family protein [Treponema sp.]